jgi:hypothetical protein
MSRLSLRWKARSWIEDAVASLQLCLQNFVENINGMGAGETMPGTFEEETKEFFTCFKDLPTELRLQIWRSCWEPRMVEVHCHINDRDQDEARYSLQIHTDPRTRCRLRLVCVSRAEKKL